MNKQKQELIFQSKAPIAFESMLEVGQIVLHNEVSGVFQYNQPNCVIFGCFAYENEDVEYMLGLWGEDRRHYTIISGRCREIVFTLNFLKSFSFSFSFLTFVTLRAFVGIIRENDATGSRILSLT
jgi:hypothetical protein